MHPILIQIGSFNVYSYGAMVALGFAVATRCIYMRAPKFGLERENAIDIAAIILLFGILGSRILYVFLNINYYLRNPLEILNLSKGGLVWYGGFILAMLALLVYTKRKSINFWTVTDLISPYVALAQAFGRLGCFLNGCCYGLSAPAWCPFTVTFPYESVGRLPAQIFSALALFAIFIILRLRQESKHFAGEIFLGYGLLYSIKRFFMEFIRADNPKIMLGLSLSQIISALVFIICFVIFSYRMAQWRKRPSISK